MRVRVRVRPWVRVRVRVGLGLLLRATLRGVRGSMGPSWLGRPLLGVGRARVMAASEVV